MHPNRYRKEPDACAIACDPRLRQPHGRTGLLSGIATGGGALPGPPPDIRRRAMILSFPYPETAAHIPQRTASTPPQLPRTEPARHADYNLHPLPTESLEHYIEYRLADDRFHVT
jgi:hypothetical protein